MTIRMLPEGPAGLPEPAAVDGLPEPLAFDALGELLAQDVETMASMIEAAMSARRPRGRALPKVAEPLSLCVQWPFVFTSPSSPFVWCPLTGAPAS
jgi:hypothetical protein